MKYLSVLLLCILHIKSTAQDKILLLGSDVWPPFTNVEGEQKVALDLVEEALNRNGITARFEITTFEEVVNSIETGNIDGSSALWKNNERAKSIMFSAPYIQNKLVLISKKGSGLNSLGEIDLKNKRLGVIEFYAYGEELEKKEWKIVKGGSHQENLEKLLNGEIDFFLADDLLVQYLMINQREEVNTYLEIAKKPIITKSLHLAISKEYPNVENIIKRFNETIVKMVADGSYNRILNLNWIRADVDGDGRLELVSTNNKVGKKAPQGSYSVLFNQNEKPALSSDRYYIQGKFYNDWNSIPQEYKSAPRNQADVSRESSFKLGFKKR
ncbi:MAG: transporter substrate-binding domain-containing protein [Bacteroidota bacterium]